jgi:hypothetical protein
MELVKNILKVFVCAIFVIALDIIIPFSSAKGIAYMESHGKFWLSIIGLVNVMIGGALSGGFYSKKISEGFMYWLRPPIYKGTINPTHGFALVALLINLCVVACME